MDPQTRRVEWYARGGDAFEAADGSAILGITSADLDQALEWPG